MMTSNRFSVTVFAAVCIDATVIWLRVLYQIAQLVIL